MSRVILDCTFKSIMGSEYQICQTLKQSLPYEMFVRVNGFLVPTISVLLSKITEEVQVEICEPEKFFNGARGHFKSKLSFKQSKISDDDITIEAGYENPSLKDTLQVSLQKFLNFNFQQYFYTFTGTLKNGDIKSVNIPAQILANDSIVYISPRISTKVSSSFTFDCFYGGINYSMQAVAKIVSSLSTILGQRGYNFDMWACRVEDTDSSTGYKLIKNSDGNAYLGFSLDLPFKSKYGYGIGHDKTQREVLKGLCPKVLSNMENKLQPYFANVGSSINIHNVDVTFSGYAFSSHESDYTTLTLNFDVKFLLPT